jgi:hypothetical protein
MMVNQVVLELNFTAGNSSDLNHTSVLRPIMLQPVNVHDGTEYLTDECQWTFTQTLRRVG